MKIETDPYCYPQTGVLINKYNVKNQEELDKIEADLTVARLQQIVLNPLAGEYDFTHL